MLSVLAVAVAAFGGGASFPSDPQPATCDVAIVGAGPGGAYLAARLADTGRHVCVFDLLQRPGGRVHSLRGLGPKGDLTVEAGAYRFALNKTCMIVEGYEWCISTPVTTHTIIDRLRLGWKQYDPSATEWDSKLAKIVDAHGQDAGFLTYVELLLKQAVATGKASVHFGREVVSLHLDDSSRDGASATSSGAPRLYTIRFAGDFAPVRAAKVILNMPQTPLLRVLAASSGLAPPGDSAANAPVLHAVTQWPIFKVYVHYSDAWWRNSLGLTAGAFNNTDAWKPSENLDPRVKDECIAARQAPAPLKGAYHDGHVRCDGPAAAPCRGFIQAAYASDPGAVRFYSRFTHHRSGDSVVHLDPLQPNHARALELLHEALVELHSDQLVSKGGAAELERVRALRPDAGVISIWDQRVDGIETGCHFTMDEGLPAASAGKGEGKGAPNARGVPKADVPAKAMAPLPSAPGLYVANEAFGVLQCFAESSLQMAENVAHSFFDAPKPWWIPEEVYRKEVLYGGDGAKKAAAARAPALGDVAVADVLQRRAGA